MVGLGVTTLALHAPAVTFWLIFAGQVMVGAILSVTVTVKEQLAELPAASLTV